MQLGIFDMFRLGIGPSSSHTVGPMRAGQHFVSELAKARVEPIRVTIDLYGSLAATGIGHGTDRAVLLGLGGAAAETVSIDAVESLMPTLRDTGRLTLMSGRSIPFELPTDLCFHLGETLPFHVNGLVLTAFTSAAEPKDEAFSKTYYSIGGGFVMVADDDVATPVPLQGDDGPARCAEDVPAPFRTAQQLITACEEQEVSVAELALGNERALRTNKQVQDHLELVLDAMFQTIEDGCTAEGILPGGLRVPRRASSLRQRLAETHGDPLALIDWVTLYALAVNEENAAGHRVVTAPTNGAAGVIPAVIGHFLVSKAAEDSGGLAGLAEQYPLWQPALILESRPDLRESAHHFLLAAAAIGSLIKTNASIAGAEVGCQGEVGSASAMAAAGLTQALGGSPAQVENAAEIAMEHSLGLTCDPVAGLVQIPCIERNALAAVKAISAARMALHGDGRHHVSLDVAIETMRQTGVDMHSKYKETSVGGLAVNVVEC